MKRFQRALDLVAVCLISAFPLAAQTEVKRPPTFVSKPTFSCVSPQIVFKASDGTLSCIGPDANPCVHGTVLDKSATPAHCKPAPFTCPAPQLAFQKSTGQWTCIAADSNPCPPGQLLDTTTKPGFAGCKPGPPKVPITCPTGQLAFQKPTGQWMCIAPDSNPCPQGQILDTTTKPGFAGCKPGPARTPFACPTGQVLVQKPDGSFICVTKS